MLVTTTNNVDATCATTTDPEAVASGVKPTTPLDGADSGSGSGMAALTTRTIGGDSAAVATRTTVLPT